MGSVFVVSEDLDELVHEVHSNMAMNINNGGLSDQIEFLLTQGGMSMEEIAEHLGVSVARLNRALINGEG